MRQEREKKRLPVLAGIIHEATSDAHKSYLIGSKCSPCGRKFFPKQSVCRICMRDDTFTVVHVAQMGFKAPFIQAFVDSPEGPRVFSLITIRKG